MDKVVIERFKSFSVADTLECGQCFNFEKLGDNFYKLIAFEKILYIRENEKEIEFFPTTELEFENIWKKYFDLHRNYDEMKEILSKDNILHKAILEGEGIHILNQDHFECLISFIISQNNRIPMIKKVVSNLSEKFGENIGEGYAFPTVEAFYKAEMEELRACKTGFRDKYIKDCCNKIYNNEIDLYKLESLENNKIMDSLMEIKGVGTKVANCVLLFSYGRGESFPVDVWIKRAMEYFYFNGEEKSKDYIQKYGEEKFGELSGIAQQYIFNYAIKTNLKI
ncbi:MAG: DNA-3-methyladenine glycosylase family protein [Lachnospirales bacterium]